MRDLNEVKEWVEKAENDFEGALDLSRRRKKPLSDLVCFHCQQAAEKYLKAILILKNEPFPKTHDLILLLDMCCQYNSSLEFHKDLFEILNPFSVQFRYPGEETNVEEAKIAIKTIKKIRAVILDLLPATIFSSRL